MPNPLSQDILSSADAVERARSAIRRYNANQQYLDALRRMAPEIGRPDPMKLEAPPELDPDQVVADVMFGKGTGSLAKDILLGFTGGFAGPATEAMGGQSGVLDWVPGGGLLKGGAMGIVAGAKNLSKKIHKPVANFIRRTAGEEGLELVDQYVKRYPKVDNLSMSDAYELLSSGRLGKEFVIDFAKEYPEEKVMSALENGATKNLTRVLNDLEEVGGDFDPKAVAKTKALVEGALEKMQQSMQSGDYLTANYISAVMNNGLRFAQNAFANHPTWHKGELGAYIDIMSDPGNAKNFNFSPDVVRKKTEDTLKRTDGRFFKLNGKDNDEATMANEYLTMQVDKLQDFDKIETQQAAKDAKQAAKATKKQPAQPAPASIPEPVVAQPEPVPQAARVMDIAEPAVEEAPVAVGGPNKWRENGWKSEDHPLSGGSYESLLGKGANEEDRRAAFVLDSLMNDAVAGLYRNKAMWWKKTNGDIGFAKSGNHELKPGEVKLDYGGDWNDFRHKAYNYDQQRLKLSRDLRENLATGNMPKSSRVILEDAYNMRTGNRIPGASRARVNGLDTYEWLFRPMVTEKILKDTPEYMGGLKK